MSESPLRERINDDVKDAMRAKEKKKLGCLRLITSAIKQREVDERIEITDDIVVSVLEKMLKQRRDSIEQYGKAGRDDLKDVEVYEVGIIDTYMPEQLSEEEVAAFVDEAIASSEAQGMKDMGKVMGIVKGKTQGQADMGLVSKLVKAKLA